MFNLNNKKVSYFMAAANVLIGLFVAIFFFATYGEAMSNNAGGQAPETIGIFALAGAIVELAVLVVPQYMILHLAGVVMFALGWFKIFILIPAPISDFFNNVTYQGGILPVQMTYFIALAIAVILGVVAAFMGFYKDQAEEDKDFKDVKSPMSLIKLGAAGAVALVAIIASSVTAGVMTGTANKQQVTESSEEAPTWNPITDDLKAVAEAYDYDFDPTSVVIREQDSYDYNDADLKAVNSNSGNREGHHLVYYFEGSYAEGYQGDYSETYAYIYLWEDGLFAGKAKDTSFKGFWYNSSKTAEEGQVDCLNMVSNVSGYESIITEETSGFYSKQAYLYLNMGWGNRSIICGGYMYYPEVALFIDAGVNGAALNYKVGDKFDTTSWVANRVLKNLEYSSVFKAKEVKWTVPSGKVDASKKLVEAGDFEVKAAWNGLEASITVHVE